MKILYTAEVRTTGGREGFAKSTDGMLEVRLTPPKELGGQGGAINPEQLFAAGYSACFESALRHVARSRKINPGSTAVTARVNLGPRADKGFQLSVALQVELPELARDVAQSLVDEAHEVCPYSHATRNNIEVTLGLS